MDIRRCLDILGLECVSSHEELKRAYRDLVQKWHPDRFYGNSKLEKKAADKLREITSAYNHLQAYFDPSQSKRLRTSIPDELSCLSENVKTGNNNNRPQKYSEIVNDGRRRHFSQTAGLGTSPALKTSSASKYIFLFLTLVVFERFSGTPLLSKIVAPFVDGVARFAAYH